MHGLNPGSNRADGEAVKRALDLASIARDNARHFVEMQELRAARDRSRLEEAERARTRRPMPW